MNLAHPGLIERAEHFGQQEVLIDRWLLHPGLTSLWILNAEHLGQKAEHLGKEGVLIEHELVRMHLQKLLLGCLGRPISQWYEMISLSYC